MDNLPPLKSPEKRSSAHDFETVSAAVANHMFKRLKAIKDTDFPPYSMYVYGTKNSRTGVRLAGLTDMDPYDTDNVMSFFLQGESGAYILDKEGEAELMELINAYKLAPKKHGSVLIYQLVGEIIIGSASNDADLAVLPDWPKMMRPLSSNHSNESEPTNRVKKYTPASIAMLGLKKIFDRPKITSVFTETREKVQAITELFYKNPDDNLIRIHISELPINKLSSAFSKQQRESIVHALRHCDNPNGLWFDGLLDQVKALDALSNERLSLNAKWEKSQKRVKVTGIDEDEKQSALRARFDAATDEMRGLFDQISADEKLRHEQDKLDRFKARFDTVIGNVSEIRDVDVNHEHYKAIDYFRDIAAGAIIAIEDLESHHEQLITLAIHDVRRAGELIDDFEDLQNVYVWFYTQYSGHLNIPEWDDVKSEFEKRWL